jgi:hypothetical protein
LRNLFFAGTGVRKKIAGGGETAIVGGVSSLAVF